VRARAEHRRRTRSRSCRPAHRREATQCARVAAADDDVVDHERGRQHGDDPQHVLAPFLLAHAPQPGRTGVVLVRSAFAVRQVRELHRREHAVDDQRATEPRAEAEEQHPAAAVAAPGLHRGVVDDDRGPAERTLEVEADPTAAEVERLADRFAVEHGAG